MALKEQLRSAAKACLESMLERRGYRLVKKRSYPSETSKCRDRLAPYCAGYGVDIGFGGDPILESSIRVDYPTPYAHTGTQSVQLGGDASHLYWFADSVLDYVYSSHLLEDFRDTSQVLKEWLRVVKPGGHLVIFCPDQRAYEAYCIKNNLTPNPNHAHADFSLDYVRKLIAEIGGTQEVHSRNLVNDYSWELVVVKSKL
jgi:predicted SAM-dependent methyltransferase